MRKRIKDNFVCSATPDGQVMKMETRQLEELVEWWMKAVECTPDTRTKARRGLELGRICEHAGHPVLALSVWTRTLNMVRMANWDVEYIPINTRLYSFDALFAYAEEQQLSGCIDRVWKQLGHSELAHYRRQARENYRSTWLAKYQEPCWE